MKIGIFLTNNNAESFPVLWREILSNQSIYFYEVDYSDINGFDKLTSADGIMCHFFHNPDEKRIAFQYLNVLEKRNKISVFPNYETRWHFDDKISQYYLLKSIGAPVANSWILYDIKQASNFAKLAIYPIVFKLSVGAGSANVLLIENRHEAERIIKLMFEEGIYPYSLNEYTKPNRNFMHRVYDSVRYSFSGENKFILRLDHSHYQLHKHYCYFQEYLSGNEYDIRVTVIGNRAFAFTRRNRPKDFRASGSGLIDYCIERIPLEAVRIAHQVSEKCGFQSMAYDFLYDNSNKPVIIEISYGYQSNALYNCPGFWDRNMNWHEGKILPEKAHIDDFIFYVKNKVLV